MPTAAPSLGPFTAPMPQFENQAFNPFFSNIRQNMELSHGPIRERFPIRLPPKCNVDPSNNDMVELVDTIPRCVAGGHLSDKGFKGPEWLQCTIREDGAQILAETYEVRTWIDVRSIEVMSDILLFIETRKNRAKKTPKYHALPLQAH